MNPFQAMMMMSSNRQLKNKDNRQLKKLPNRDTDSDSQPNPDKKQKLPDSDSQPNPNAKPNNPNAKPKAFRDNKANYDIDLDLSDEDPEEEFKIDTTSILVLGDDGTVERIPQASSNERELST